jgi:hypothetical protein
MTSADHLENLAVLKTYICQGITTLSKSPHSTSLIGKFYLEAYKMFGDLILTCIGHCDIFSPHNSLYAFHLLYKTFTWKHV